MKEMFEFPISVEGIVVQSSIVAVDQALRKTRNVSNLSKSSANWYIKRAGHFRIFH